MMGWKRIETPKSRVIRAAVPVTAEELAAAIHAGKVPGLFEWTPKLINAERDRWEWSPKMTKMVFRTPTANR